jgi:hypothetical protein
MTPSAPAIVAVVVGSNGAKTRPRQSRDGRSAALRYADNDAFRNYELFTMLGTDVELVFTPDEDMRGSWVPKNRPRAERGALKSAIKRATKRIRELNAKGRRVVFYFWYSGHGGINQGDFELELTEGFFTSSDLREMLNGSEAYFNHVIIDACYSGALSSRSTPLGPLVADVAQNAGPPPPVPIEHWEKADKTGWVLADREDNVWELDALKGGLVSHVVRSGLYGAADINGDRVVTYSELEGFVGAANDGISQKARPDIKVNEPDGPDPDFLSWRTPRTRVRLLTAEAATTGHFWVSDDSVGGRLIEFNTDGSYETKIALPPRETYGLMAETERASFVFEDAAVTKVEDVMGFRRRPLDRPTKGNPNHPDEEKVREGLFKEAFGRHYYLGSCRPDCVRLDPLRKKSMPVRKKIALVSFGGAAAAALTGLTFRLIGDGAHDEFVRAKAPDVRERWWDRTHTYDVAAAVSFAVAGTAALVGGGLLIAE